MENLKNPKFLKEKYGTLHTSPEVQSAAKRTELRTKEKVPQSSEKHIQNYLNRFSEILDLKDSDKRKKVKLKHYEEFFIRI